ncbi:MAG: hypothetical protein WDN00_07930 [Limisphaerales bacterium]
MTDAIALFAIVAPTAILASMPPLKATQSLKEALRQPLIFDQPEDDLDNEFIIEELVEIFRGIKQFRQVILVTHNANLVVNADAEQVIVAENVNGVLKYTSGSLEAEVTNKAVRRILEGGDEGVLEARASIQPQVNCTVRSTKHLLNASFVGFTALGNF